MKSLRLALGDRLTRCRERPTILTGNPFGSLYFYDPAPTLRQLGVPVLALFGELDNNILAEKNRAAWEAALKAGGHRDFTLRILAKANHFQWEAKIGSNAEMISLQRFVPDYFPTIQDWLAKRIPSLGASAPQ